jgi:hypothetical protein
MVIKAVGSETARRAGVLLAWLPIVVGHEAQTVNSAECHRADRERSAEEVPFSESL